jgi:hypothetical protein
VLDDADGTANPTISPSTIDFSNGLWSGAVVVTEATPIILRVGQGSGLTTDQTGTTLQIDPAALSKFEVTVPSPQTSGTVFTAGSQVVAQDQYSNTVTTFDASANNVTISASNGGTMINNVLNAAGDFIGGVADLNATGTTYTDVGGVSVQFTASSAGPVASGTSSNILVNQAPATQYVITNSATVESNDPYIAGTGFEVTIEARDVNGNLVTNYNGAGIVLDDADGAANPTISPSSITFSSGVWNGLVSVTEATPVILRVGQGSGLTTDQTGTSLQIDPAILHHFSFTTQPDPTEVVNVAFPIRMQAFDQYDNLLDSGPNAYNGTATLADSTGTITPNSAPFGNGDSGVVAVQITTEQPNILITVSDGAADGKSVPFNVIGNEVAVSTTADLSPDVAFAGDTIQMFEVAIDNQAADMDLNGMSIYVGKDVGSSFFVLEPSAVIQQMRIDDLTNGGFYLQDSIPATQSPVPFTLPAILVPSGTSIDLRVTIQLANTVSPTTVPNVKLRVATVDGDRGGTPALPVVNNYTDQIPITDPGGYVDSGITQIRSSGENAAFNYPNPFNPRVQSTTISYYSTGPGSTTIKIFTVTGKLVTTIQNSLTTAGSNSVTWDGRNGRGQVVRNGVYVAIILPPGGGKQVVKIAVVK